MPSFLLEFYELRVRACVDGWMEGVCEVSV